jgi:hypothetical protein
MAAVKGDRHRAAAQQAHETGQASILIRQHERRHRLARRRCLHSGAVGRKPRDQLIDRGCIVRDERPDRPRIGLEPLAEPGIHISTSKKDFAERCESRGRHEGRVASGYRCICSSCHARFRASSKVTASTGGYDRSAGLELASSGHRSVIAWTAHSVRSKQSVYCPALPCLPQGLRWRSRT